MCTIVHGLHSKESMTNLGRLIVLKKIDPTTWTVDVGKYQECFIREAPESSSAVKFTIGFHTGPISFITNHITIFTNWVETLPRQMKRGSLHWLVSRGKNFVCPLRLSRC